MQHRDTFLQNATKKELIKYFQLVNRLAQNDATYGKILADDLHQYGGSLFNFGKPKNKTKSNKNVNNTGTNITYTNIGDKNNNIREPNNRYLKTENTNFSTTSIVVDREGPINPVSPKTFNRKGNKVRGIYDKINRKDYTPNNENTSNTEQNNNL